VIASGEAQPDADSVMHSARVTRANQARQVGHTLEQGDDTSAQYHSDDRYLMASTYQDPADETSGIATRSPARSSLVTDRELPVGHWMPGRSRPRDLESLRVYEPRSDRDDAEDWRSIPLLIQGARCGNCFGNDHRREECTFFRRRCRLVSRLPHERLEETPTSSISKPEAFFAAPEQPHQEVYDHAEETVGTPNEESESHANVVVEVEEDVEHDISSSDRDGLNDATRALDPWRVEVPGAFPQ
jgi:hypothetical protein